MDDQQAPHQQGIGSYLTTASAPEPTRTEKPSRRRGRATKQVAQPIDTGTPELAKRKKLKLERGVGVVRIRSATSTLLDKMLFLNLIGEEEYNVVDDLLADMFRFGHVRLKAFNLQGCRSGLSPAPDTFQDRRCSLQKTLTHLGDHLGPSAVTTLYALHLQDCDEMEGAALEQLSRKICLISRALADLRGCQKE